jgi:hypothetical protein
LGGWEKCNLFFAGTADQVEKERISALGVIGIDFLIALAGSNDTRERGFGYEFWNL